MSAKSRRKREEREANATRGTEPDVPRAVDDDALVAGRRHLRFGWWTLLVFLTLGAVLEAFHGFKVRLYLDVANETRRLLWTLAHAHGTLLALIHIAFGLSVLALPELAAHGRGLASRALFGATLLLPGGFFLGGAFAREGDPGLGILLVPPAVVLLVAGVFVTASSIRKKDPG